jgi:hypothetical protein
MKNRHVTRRYPCVPLKSVCRGNTKKCSGDRLLMLFIVTVTSVTPILLYNIYTYSKEIQRNTCVCERVSVRVPPRRKTGVQGVQGVTASEMMGKQASEVSISNVFSGNSTGNKR